MKFTKKEVEDIKWYFRIIKNRMSINTLFETEQKKVIPEYYKINLIRYGYFYGRIVEIIKRRIDYKNNDNNLNADELILEKFGKEFFDWLCGGNKKFIHGNNYDNSHIDTIFDLNDVEPDEKRARKIKDKKAERIE